ncbi:hypothetical protein RRG08_024985 [Elysia crispata]|uniref:Uncharacterized protein n=1 Tax=Elysia crispata TaxID=231223 RepID=A0AAE1E3L0_9GAST|nr:hypothetical protein RRG08_024985 [Elysia crispata]
MLELLEAEGPFVTILLALTTTSVLFVPEADTSDLLPLTTIGPLVFAVGVAMGTRGFGLKSDGSNLSEKAIKMMKLIYRK